MGESSAGHGGELQQISPVEEANEESVEELADINQSFEAAVVEGVEDAADHPDARRIRMKNMAGLTISRRTEETMKQLRQHSAISIQPKQLANGN